MNKINISIIVPCFNEQDSINMFYKELITAIETMKDTLYEVIFIDDGSSDNTLQTLKELSKQNINIKYISFSRNFGKEAAIFAGLKNATGDFAVLMDADLQDPPSLLPQMYELVKNGEYDSIATRRISRKGEPKIRSFFARQFYKLMSKIADVDLVDGARDFRIMNRRFIDAVLSLREYNRFSKGLFGWVGFKTKWLEYENIQRAAGETKWSFWSLFLYAIDGIVAFSTAPLIISAVVGLILSTISFCSIIFIIIQKLFLGTTVQGWASSMSVGLFIGGLLMLFIGIIGEYLSKIYLEIKHRPIYIEKEKHL